MIIDFKGAGPQGMDGKSAYQIAVDNGFAGTEQEWLDSLKGAEGPQGIQGEQGIQGIQGEPGPEGPKVKLQEKNYTITQNGDTSIAPDPEFDGIFQGTITTNVQPLLQEKTVEITGNGTTTIVPEQGYYGISKVVANTKVSATGSALDITGTGWENGEAVFPVALNRTASLNDDIEYTKQKFAAWDPNNSGNLDELYENDKNLIYAPKIDTSNATRMGNDWGHNGTFKGCSNLVSIPKLNISKVKTIENCFSNCSKLTTIPLLDTSSVTNMNSCFNGCRSLTTIPQLNTSKVTNMYGCFNNCSSLTTIPQLNTSKVTNMEDCFYNCSSLTSIPQLDTSAVTIMSYCFYDCSSLTNLGGFTGLKVSFDLSYSPKLAKQSVLNVLNGLYDFRGNGDASTTRTIKFHPNSIALLSDEEKAIATNKGWVLA